VLFPCRSSLVGTCARLAFLCPPQTHPIPTTTATLTQEFTGHYPGEITVVSFGFKQERFESYHRAALRFPKVSRSVDQPDKQTAR
jgi:hypothetical protein